ncbi:3-hydroxyacyl-ACP dehydratase FabZ family protein [Desulfosarcina ovata]|nr:hypothetical protein [Desulfosarcina ovata]
MKIRTMPDSTDRVAEATIAPDSPWFDGHFPNQPVLPGIAQLEMVFDLIRRYASRPLRIAEVSRVRFKRMIVPEDRVTIVATPRPANANVYTFRLEKADGLVTTGTMTVETTTEETDN